LFDLAFSIPSAAESTQVGESVEADIIFRLFGISGAATKPSRKIRGDQRIAGADLPGRWLTPPGIPKSLYFIAGLNQISSG
jgi:hypothetical protein